MTLDTALEMILEHHPDVQKNIILVHFNRKMDEFARRTRINKSWESITTVANQMYYDKPTNVFEIEAVTFQDTDIEREICPPVHATDASLAS